MKYFYENITESTENQEHQFEMAQRLCNTTVPSTGIYCVGVMSKGNCSVSKACFIFEYYYPKCFPSNAIDSRYSFYTNLLGMINIHVLNVYCNRSC